MKMSRPAVALAVVVFVGVDLAVILPLLALLVGPRLCLSYGKAQAAKARHESALRLLRLGCLGREFESCYEAAGIVLGAPGVPKDPVLAGSLLEKACAGQFWTACDKLAGMLATGGPGIRKDVARAAELHTKACRGGIADSCLAVGALLESGEGLAKDPARGTALLRRGAELLGKGCAAGDAKQCHGLAVLHLDGRGVAKDAARGAELLRQACDSGRAESCSRLAGLHSEGEGVPKDAAKASALRRRAFKLALAEARARHPRAVLVRTRDTGVLALDGLLFHLEMTAAESKVAPETRLQVALAEESGWAQPAPWFATDSRFEIRLPLADKPSAPTSWDAEPADYDCLVSVETDQQEHTKYSYGETLRITVRETWSAECRYQAGQPRWQARYELEGAPASFPSEQQRGDQAKDQLTRIVAPKRGPILRELRRFIAGGS